MKIGDRIRDLEDGDCYYEGVIISLNPLKYEVTNIIWNGEVDNSMNGQVIKLQWWILEMLIDGKWVRQGNLKHT